ncbi:MAG: hypothetical protein ACWA5K_03660 [bacterium]
MATCSSCGGSGRETVVNSGGLPEFGNVCPVCGGSGTIGNYQPEYGSSRGERTRSKDTSASDPVETTITLITLFMWLGGWYYLTGHLSMKWYWGLGISFLAGQFLKYLLEGPLHGFITFIVYAVLYIIGAAVLLFIAAFIFKLFSE